MCSFGTEHIAYAVASSTSVQLHYSALFQFLTDGFVHALLKQIQVKLVLRGHLHNMHPGNRNNMFPRVFPVGFQLVTLWLRGLHRPEGRCFITSVQHSGPCTSPIHPFQNQLLGSTSAQSHYSVTFNQLHSQGMNIVQDCVRLSEIQI